MNRWILISIIGAVLFAQGCGVKGAPLPPLPPEQQALEEKAEEEREARREKERQREEELEKKRAEKDGR